MWHKWRTQSCNINCRSNAVLGCSACTLCIHTLNQRRISWCITHTLNAYDWHCGRHGGDDIQGGDVCKMRSRLQRLNLARATSKQWMWPPWNTTQAWISWRRSTATAGTSVWRASGARPREEETGFISNGPGHTTCLGLYVCRVAHEGQQLPESDWTFHSRSYIYYLCVYIVGFSRTNYDSFAFLLITSCLWVKFCHVFYIPFPEFDMPFLSMDQICGGLSRSSARLYNICTEEHIFSLPSDNRWIHIVQCGQPCIRFVLQKCHSSELICVYLN